MADEKNRYYWIKLKKDFFDEKDGPIDFIMSQENGSQYIVLYLMMCLNTANTDGLLCNKIGEMIVPYNIEKIVRDTKFFSFDTVAVALELFKKLGMVYEEDNGILRISNLHEMVGSESANREAIKKRQQRLKKKIQENQNILEDKQRTNCLTENRDESLENIEDEEPIKEQKKESTKARKKPINYQQIVDKYNEICVSFPKVIKISSNRKEAISARLNVYSVDEIIRAFEKAEESNFLKGSNDRNWKADFDWIMSDRNIVKVLEGKYDNDKSTPKNASNNSTNKFNNFSQRNYSKEQMDELEKKLLSK